MTRRWRPSPAIKLGIATHAAAGLGVLAAPAMWPLALGAMVASQSVLIGAGMLPRSSLLGPNFTRLPAEAATRGEFALTIDDGPYPEITPRVLDMLDAAGARASFFCIGEKAQRHPALTREIVTRGHAVENHSMHHLHHFAALGPAGMRREVEDGQRCLADITGREPGFFRPTAGLRSPFLEPILVSLGLHLASWTRRAFDTQRGNPQRALQRLATPLGGGDILLLHDDNAALTPAGVPLILAVLPRLLEVAAERQLQSVTLASVIPPRT